jgi:hypothetical protein
MIQPFLDKLIHFVSKIGKRQRFIIASLILMVSVLVSSFSNINFAWLYFIIIFIVSFLVSFIAIPTGLNKIERVMLFLLPVYFTFALDLFFFFLPSRWLTRLPFIVIYGISTYAILLSANILNVGSQKSIQLLRAAFSVNFLYLTLSSFLIFNLILSFRLSFFLNFIAVLVVLFPLTLQFVWSVNPKTIIERITIKYAIFLSFVIAQVALIFSFLPIKPTVFSLLLTACLYSLNGLFYAYLEERLFKERIREFLFVLGFVFVIILLSVRWN